MATVGSKPGNVANDASDVAVDGGRLHIFVCGAAGDGKTTLVGRLPGGGAPNTEDGAARSGTGRGVADDRKGSLLFDGLSAGRRPGAATGIAYRIFQTDRRNVVVADTPGDAQYTRDLATGASVADLAVVMVDASRGVRTQTRRHAAVVHVMGIRHLLVAVNKMDSVGWSEQRFREVEMACASLAADLGIEHVTAIPVSALHGDNVLEHGDNMPWYRGPTVVAFLETVQVEGETEQAFRFPVQSADRAQPHGRACSGTVRGGSVRPGDAVRVWPSGGVARVDRIVVQQGDGSRAVSGDAATLVLDGAVDVSRGDLITRDGETPVVVADQIQAKLIWLGGEKLVPGRRHLVRFSAAATPGQIMTIKYRLDVESAAHLGTRTLEENDIGIVTLSLDRGMPIDSYAENRETGSFILIDRDTNAAVAVGMIEFPLRRATNIVWHEHAVDKSVRAGLKDQQPRCLWFTGLSGSGKSTVANLVDKRLTTERYHTYVLDGDNVRHGLNKDLGFTEPDRVENIRRMAEVAKLMVDAGLIVLVCAISPYRRDREMVRGLFGDGEFVEVFVDTPLAVCEGRDPKGLYEKARRGLIPNFTGISAPYEPPETPELRLDGERPADELVERVFDRLRDEASSAASDDSV